VDLLEQIVVEFSRLVAGSFPLPVAVLVIACAAVVLVAAAMLGPQVGPMLKRLRDAAPDPQPPSAEAPQADVAGGGVSDSKWADNVEQNTEPAQPDEIGGG
jgi:hypothetical protein